MLDNFKPFNIVIVGAGMGGLSAALCLARDGHQVQVYERRATFEPKGGGIMIRPNASRYLKQWGLEQDFLAVSDPAGATVYINALDGKVFKRQKPEVFVDRDADWGCFRDEAQAIFYRHAIRLGAKIDFGVAVTDVFEDEKSAKVHLGTGQIVEADLLLAADGVSSRLRPKIIANAPSPIPGWSTLYQIRASGKEVLADPQAKSLASGQDLQIWMKRGGGGYAVLRYNKSVDRMSGSFGIPERDNETRMWDEHGDIDYVRNYFKDYSPILTSFLKIVDRCDRWRVAEMPDLPSWTSPKCRLLLLGDSAHAMFSDAAQGFSTIIEDIAVLAYLLKNRSSRPVPELTKIWQDVRQPRVNRIKQWARANHLLYTKGTDEGMKGKSAPPRPERQVSLKNVKPDMNAPYRSLEFVKWAFGYDAVGEGERYLKEKDERVSARL